jgi:thiamine pyrophosphokinase
VQASSARLVFPGLLVIVGGGALDEPLLRHLAARGAALVGADGGGDAIARAGLVPDAIIGDFDSLADPEGWSDRTRLLRIEEQETTDFEKALYSTQAPVTLALGMTGKRFDHTLAALNAVMRHASERAIVLVDEHDLALALIKPFRFQVPPGARISVHPLAPVRFSSSSGLRFPLDGLRLAPGERIGTSNEAVEGPFSITPENGNSAPWLLILDQGLLGALVDTLLKEEGPPARLNQSLG